MRRRRLISKETTSFLKLASVFFALGIAFRLIFFFTFKNTSDLTYTTSEVMKALHIGFKFDLRAALLLSLPFWFLGYTLKLVNAVFEEKERKMFLSNPQHPTGFLSFFFTCTLSLYTFFLLLDLGFYEHSKNRLDASSTVFFNNPLVSLQTLSESYPLGVIAIATIITLLFFYSLIKTLIFREDLFVSGQHIFRTSFKITVPLFLLLAALGHGKASFHPLKWSDALFSSNNFISSLSLNPLLYFKDTLSFKEKPYDLEKVKKHYPLVSSYLGVENPDVKTLNFKRSIKETPNAFDTPPHIVVIMMKSLASFKISHFGQKANGTPFLDSLIPKSLFFENAFVTSTGTDRSVFGMITGLPDVNSIEPASKTPSLLKQYSAANALSDYNKSYFIGGDKSFENIRSLVSQSLKDVAVFEEKDFNPTNNSGKIFSDLNLFTEANNYLKNQTKLKKQFTFIQTAGYDRPHTLPTETKDFKIQTLSQKEIEENGFKSNKEYNSLRFSDYSLGEFFKLASKEDYFQNTLFVIYADHGLSHYKSNSIKDGVKRFKLPIMHIPLLYFSKNLKLKPQVFSKVAYAPDILPSAISLAGKSYENKTLGRNLFDERYDLERYAMTVSSFSPPISLRIHNGEWITEGTRNKLNGLFPYKSPNYEEDLTEVQPIQQNRMDRLGQGLLETTKYLYYNSSK